MNESDFIELNEHLQEVRPIFDSFNERNNFVYVDRKALGRYPRIRIERNGSTNIWFDLWMEYDEEGNKFEVFRYDLPYELSAGAYVDVQEASTNGVRFQKCIQCFSGKPFNQIGVDLASEMQKQLCILEEWDVQYLKDKGERIRLGG